MYHRSKSLSSPGEALEGSVFALKGAALHTRRLKQYVVAAVVLLSLVSVVWTLYWTFLVSGPPRATVPRSYHRLAASVLLSGNNISLDDLKNRDVFVSRKRSKVIFLHPTSAEHVANSTQVAALLRHREAHAPAPPRTTGAAAATCAVVGNSGQLLAARLGRHVDAAEVVVRVNDGPTVGFEADVGRRTTYRVMYPELHFSEPARPHTQVFGLFQPKDLSWLYHRVHGWEMPADERASMWIQSGRPAYNLSDVALLGDAVAHLGARLYAANSGVVARDRRRPADAGAGWGYPSTGFLAVLLASLLCEHVTLYGFGAYNNMLQHLGVPYHYYETKRHPFWDYAPDKGDPHHAYDLEREMYDMMRSRGHLTYGDAEIVEKMLDGMKQKDPSTLLGLLPSTAITSVKSLLARCGDTWELASTCAGEGRGGGPSARQPVERINPFFEYQRSFAGAPVPVAPTPAPGAPLEGEDLLRACRQVYVHCTDATQRAARRPSKCRPVARQICGLGDDDLGTASTAR